MTAKTINWKELARSKPHEIVLSGDKISKQLEEEDGVLNELVYGINSLNFLEVTDTPALKSISINVGKLENLTNLVLRGNKLDSIPVEIGNLSKLKCLDLSRNELTTLSDTLLLKCTNLQTLNLEQNKLESLPDMSTLESLLVLKFGSNQVKEFPSSLCDKIYKKEYESESSPIPIFGGGAVRLSELDGSHNLIDSIPTTIRRLFAIKTLDLSFNQITKVPGELGDCPKLKELYLKENPLKDRRLYKLIEQCPTKKQLDYIRANIPISKESKEQDAAKANGPKTKGATGDLEVAFTPAKSITIQQQSESSEIFRVIATKQIVSMRKIVACILHDVDLSKPKIMKKFIQIQTKLHEGICDNRQKATIATHDLAKIIPPPITFATKLAAPAVKDAPEIVQQPPPPKAVYFDGKVPTRFKLIPLGRTKEVTGMELYRSLNEEADQYRKEKKRNTISGIHKYLHLLKGKQVYPVLLDYTKEKVFSLPPLTNADYSKISATTTDVFVEVTGESVPTCRAVINELINQFLSIEAQSEEGESKMDTLIPPKADGSAGSLIVEPVVVETAEGELIVKYPSKIDLQFDNVQVETINK